MKIGLHHEVSYATKAINKIISRPDNFFSLNACHDKDNKYSCVDAITHQQARAALTKLSGKNIFLTKEEQTKLSNQLFAMIETAGNYDELTVIYNKHFNADILNPPNRSSIFRNDYFDNKIKFIEMIQEKLYKCKIDIYSLPKQYKND